MLVFMFIYIVYDTNYLFIDFIKKLNVSEEIHFSLN